MAWADVLGDVVLWCDRPGITSSVSCRRSLLRSWRHCNFRLTGQRSMSPLCDQQFTQVSMLKDPSKSSIRKSSLWNRATYATTRNLMNLVRKKFLGSMKVADLFNGKSTSSLTTKSTFRIPKREFYQCEICPTCNLDGYFSVLENPCVPVSCGPAPVMRSATNISWPLSTASGDTPHFRHGFRGACKCVSCVTRGW